MGCQSKDQENVPAPNQAPNAALQVTTILTNTGQVTFSTEGTADADGTIVSFSLDFGDGTVLALPGLPDPTYVHTYPTTNTYVATLRVTDNSFSGAAMSVSVHVDIPAEPPPDDSVPPPTVDDPPPDIPVPPLAVLTYVDGRYKGQPYSLSTAGTLDPDGAIASYTMDWGDGTVDSGTGTPPAALTHTYATSGTRTVTLTVVDTDNLQGVATRQVVIEDPIVVNQPPVAKLTLVSLSYAGSPVTVSTAGTQDPENALASGTLDWGDGTTVPITGAPASTYTHTYAAAGSKTVTLSVTDAGGKVSPLASLAFTLGTAPPPPSGTRNDYFAALDARPDRFRSLSLRPVAGDTTQASAYWEKQLLGTSAGGYQRDSSHPAITYDYAGDTDPNKIDAAKLVIPAWYSTGSVLTQAVSPTDTVLHVNPFSFAASNFIPGGKQFRIITGGVTEYMSIVSKDATASTVTVKRGTLGSTPIAHNVGDGIDSNTNTIPTNLVYPLGMGALSAEDKVGHWLLTWDALWTSSYVKTGLTNHKCMNIETGSGSIWLEPDTFFNGLGNPAFNSATDVADFGSRSYSYQFGPAVTSRQPLAPQLNRFIIKPNKITRFWYLIDIKAIDQSAIARAAKLSTDFGVADTAIRVVITGELTGEFTYKNNYYQIDSEWLRATGSGVKQADGSYIIPVSRALFGTTQAAHVSGASVKGACTMHISAWVADEDRDAVQLYNDLPTAPRPIVGGNDNALVDIVWEYNTSTDDPRTRYDRDLVGYSSNFWMGHSATLHPVTDGLLLRPVR